MSGIETSNGQAKDTGKGWNIGGLAAAVCAMTMLLIGGSFAVALDAGSAPVAVWASDDDPLLGTPGEMDVEEISVTRNVMAKRPAQPAYVFTVRNDSTVASVDITRMSDATLGELNGQGNCVLPQTLAASELYTCHVNVTGIDPDMPFAGVTVLARGESGAWLAGWARTPQSGLDEARNEVNPAVMVLGSSIGSPTSTNSAPFSEQEMLIID